MSVTCKWKKVGHDATVTWANRLDGCLLWPPPIQVKVEEQAHATCAGKIAPTSWQGPGRVDNNAKEDTRIAEALKLKQNLLSNFY
jgi:hypothetical protein